jgi:hypothetical protein
VLMNSTSSEASCVLKVITIVGHATGDHPAVAGHGSPGSTTTEHVLVHTGQNYDYELNQVFFDDLGSVSRTLPRGCGSDRGTDHRPGHHRGGQGAGIEEQPDAMLVLGDTNSCLAAIAAKRRKVPIFHMEAGNRCFDFSACPRRSTDASWTTSRHQPDLQRHRARVPAARRPAARPGDLHRQPDARGDRALPPQVSSLDGWRGWA